MSITADRVKETTTTTGTGTYSLAGAKTGFRAFSSAFISGDVVQYCVADATNWEVGEGTLTTGSPWTLARTTILASSNSNNAVDWAAGTRDVFTTLSALRYGREILTAARTYYVRTDGSDSNNGLANTSGGAFLTLQKAVNVVCALDMSIYQVTIQVGNGTYTAGASLGAYTGAYGPIIQGDTSTPSNVLVSVTSSTCFANSSGRAWVVKGFKLATTTSGHALYCGKDSLISHANMDFGSCVNRHMSGDGGTIIWTTGYTVSGGADYHMLADHGGTVRTGGGSTTVTLTGTPAFSGAFAYAVRLGEIYATNVTYSGSATGTRYSISKNAVADTNGGGANYFPGSVAGSTATGGQYV